jgi:hypothetical protein
MRIVNVCYYVMQGMYTELDMSGVIFVTGWTEWKIKNKEQLYNSFQILTLWNEFTYTG